MPKSPPRATEDKFNIDARKAAGTLFKKHREERHLTRDELVGVAHLYLPKPALQGSVSHDEDRSLSSRTLMRFENGEGNLPLRGNLIAFLDALESTDKLPAGVRIQILAPFGYRDKYELPSDAEIQRELHLWRKSVSKLPHPVCLVDCGHRILDWNAYAPHLIGLTSRDGLMESFRRKTLLDMLFHSQYAQAFGIENSSAFLHDMLETMRAEFEPYKQEDWCKQCIESTKQQYPDFKALWEEIEQRRIREVTQRLLGPFQLNPLGKGSLTFFLLGMDSISDARFRTIHYIPADETTMARCLTWIQEEARFPQKTRP